jgi:lipopolysaccharide transport system permease protein
LPERPLIRIRSDSGWGRLNIADIWTRRELLYYLAWRDVKVRYKQTLLGIAWVAIQPLATMLIFAILFGNLVGIPSDGVPYPLFAYAGLLVWGFFANAISSSGNSLVGSASLLTRVYFPRILIPAAAVAAGFVDLAIGFSILFLLIAYYGVPVSWAFTLLPALVLVTVLLAFGVGLFTSLLNVKYRDVRYAFPFILQLWMFVTPIIYPSTLVPEAWRWMLVLNPMTGIVEGFRAALFGLELRWVPLAISAAITVVLLVSSVCAFRWVERTFADVV